LSVCRHAPLLASHILTVLSLDAEASRVESCEKATELTQRLISYVLSWKGVHIQL
jgi:hypothetical protein